MRRVFPFVMPQGTIVARFSAGNPPTGGPPPSPGSSSQGSSSSQQSVNANNNQQQRGNSRSIVIGAIIALIILLLLACVALAPGFLAGKNTSNTNSTPSPGIAKSSPSPAVSPSPSTSTMVAGLTGEYYRMPALVIGKPVPAMPTGTPVFTTVDPNIDVPHGVWGVDGTQHYPHLELGNLGPNGFAIRWTGYIQPSETGSYTFTTKSDDGVRVWVNQQLLVDNWTSHGVTTNCSVVAGPETPVAATAHGCSTISLTANQYYAIRVEYYENGIGGAQMQLFWQASSTAQPQIVPASALFHQP